MKFKIEVTDDKNVNCRTCASKVRIKKLTIINPFIDSWFYFCDDCLSELQDCLDKQVRSNPEFKL